VDKDYDRYGKRWATNIPFESMTDPNQDPDLKLTSQTDLDPRGTILDPEHCSTQGCTCIYWKGGREHISQCQLGKKYYEGNKKKDKNLKKGTKRGKIKLKGGKI
jgi:hypothetical protein